MSAARAERLLNLLTLLLNTRRPVSLREIRELEEFSAYRTDDPKSGERAFERDKAALVELGVPLRWVPPEQEEDEEGTGGYVVDRERYYLAELELSPTELALLSLAGTAAVGLPDLPFRGAALRALAKLGFDVAEDGIAPTLAHTPLAADGRSKQVGDHLDELHRAVAERRRVTLRYERRDGSSSTREIDPYGLYHRQGAWYLVGHCHLRDAERTFHLGRIAAIEPATARAKPPHFEVPSSFDLGSHTRRRPWAFPQEPPFDVTIRLAERLTPAVGEIFGPDAKLERRRGETLIRLSASHRQALIATVLPYGAAAEVLEPEDLRAEVGAIYRELAERYADTKGGER